MKKHCQYFKVNRSVTHSKALTGNRNPLKPIISEKAYCTHPESIHRIDAISAPAVCDGNVENCDIPMEKR